MIPFFRKIRKKMADDNKPLKYMRYAIGEIVLVVIGILIALSINNWNEGRKRTNKGKDYINEIFNDVQNDVTNIKNILKELESQKRNSGIVLSVFESKDKYVADSIKFVNQTISTNAPIPVQRQTNTYDELKATGQLSIVANDSLISKVSQFYEEYDSRIYQYLETPGQVRYQNRTTFQECLNKVATDNYWEEKGTNNYKKSWFNCFLNSPKALTEVRVIYSSTHWQLHHFNRLLNTGQSVVEYLDKAIPVDL